MHLFLKKHNTIFSTNEIIAKVAKFMRIYSAHIENQSRMWKKIKIKQLDNNKKDFVVAIHKIEISLYYMIMLSCIVNGLV